MVPLSLNNKLSKEHEPMTKENVKKMATVPYQVVVGSLLLASQVFRLDFSFAVSYARRFSKNPGPKNWAAVKRILSYVKGTSNRSIEFNGKQPTKIIGYCDADRTIDEERK